MACRPVLTNVIGTGQLQIPIKLDLHYIASKVQGSRLNLKKFPGIIIRKTKPKGTILLFSSNKFLIIGANNQQNCQVLSRKIARDLHKILNIPSIKIKSFKIANMIANGHLGYEVNISRIAQLPNAYKDDKSSGVFIRMGKVKCVVVYQSGKILLNGAKKFNDIQEIYDKLVKDLQQFKLKYTKNNQIQQKSPSQTIKKTRGRPKKVEKSQKSSKKQTKYRKNQQQQEQYQQNDSQKEQEQNITNFSRNNKYQDQQNNNQSDDQQELENISQSIVSSNDDK